MVRALSLLLLAAAAPLSAQTTAALSPEIPSVADSLKRAVPGTRVRIAPPPGFIPTVRFSGFQDTRSIAAIMVVEVPVPFARATRDMTPQTLAGRGLELLSSSRLRVGGHPAALLLTRQSAGGMRMEKQVLAFGHDSATVLITANYPDTSVARLREPIRRSVLSADWSGTGPVDVILVDLPFEVTEAPGLKRAGRITNTRVFTESGVFPAQSPGEAVAAVGVSLQPADLGDLAAFSRGRLRQTLFLSGVSVRSGAPVQIGGRAAYELVADARETRHDIAMVVYQVVIPDASGYTLFQAQVGADRADRFLPLFREMARSLRLRRAAGR